MLDIRSVLLSLGFPVADDVPGAPTDSRAAWLAKGVAGVSLGERDVQVNAEDNRRLQWITGLSFVLGLTLAGFGVAWVAIFPKIVPYALPFVIPGSFLIAYGLVSWIRTDFRSYVIRVVVRSPAADSSWVLLPPGSPATIEVTGGLALSSNGPVGRYLRKVFPDSQVASLLRRVVDAITDRASSHGALSH
jgi:hypothetical protein